MRDDRLRLRGVNTERERAGGLFTGARLTLWHPSQPLLWLTALKMPLRHGCPAWKTPSACEHIHCADSSGTATHLRVSVGPRSIGVSDTHLLRGVETWRCDVHRHRSSLKGSGNQEWICHTSDVRYMFSQVWDTIAHQAAWSSTSCTYPEMYALPTLLCLAHRFAKIVSCFENCDDSEESGHFLSRRRNQSPVLIKATFGFTFWFYSPPPSTHWGLWSLLKMA